MKTTKNLFNDYATVPVPEEKRVSWLTQSSVWAGITFCEALFSLSGLLASSMPPLTYLLSVLLGAAVLSAIALLIGAIGARTHLSSSFNARFALGAKGGQLFGLILAASMFGWFGCQCLYFAKGAISMLQRFGRTGGSEAGWAVVGGLMMMITVVAGLKGITLLSTLGAPLLSALTLAALFITVGEKGFSGLTAASAVPGQIGLAGGIGLVVGSFTTGSCIISDLSRFSHSPKDAARACGLGFAVTFPVLFLVGGFFCYTYGTAELSEVLITYCGMGVFMPFVLVVSIWTTNDYNLYSAVLGISNALDDHIKLPRWQITLIMGTVSTLLGALGIMEAFTAFLNLLSTLIPPVAAVILADYYLYNRHSGLYAYENAEKLRGFRVNTCLSALTGIAVGLLCGYTGIGFLQALCGVVPACIVEMLVSVAALVLSNALFPAGTAPFKPES